MKKNDLILLRHMLDAAKEAVSFTIGRSRDSLEQDRMLLLSLVKDIEIVGEAAVKISEECRNEFPNISWISIIGMRNRLIHAYFDINHDIVWNTVIQDLPELIGQLEAIIKTEDNK